MPAGVLQVVTGDAEDAPVIGGELTSNPVVAQALLHRLDRDREAADGASAPRQVKKVSLELGGNAPFLVFDDADLDAAVEGAILCKFRNSGQTCVSANRILVQDSVHDEFVARFEAAVGRLVVGNGLDDGHAGRPADRRGRPSRRSSATSPTPPAPAPSSCAAAAGSSGTFFEPTVLTGVDGSMAMTREETFGPVAGIQRFAAEDEAIRLANDTPYGLAAYFYSQRPRPRLARLGRARVRDPRRQHRHHLDRGGAVRRHEGVGDRPRGLEVRPRRLARAQVRLHGCLKQS